MNCGCLFTLAFILNSSQKVFYWTDLDIICIMVTMAIRNIQSHDFISEEYDQGMKCANHQVFINSFTKFISHFTVQKMSIFIQDFSSCCISHEQEFAVLATLKKSLKHNFFFCVKYCPKISDVLEKWTLRFSVAVRGHGVSGSLFESLRINFAYQTQFPGDC